MAHRHSSTRTQRKAIRRHQDPALPTLVNQLADAGWGQLRGQTHRGPARVLDKLCKHLDQQTGAGTLSVVNLSGMTCYSERWVRRSLTHLVSIGVIEWHQAPGNSGTGPSRFRVSRSALLKLIGEARELGEP